MLTNLVQHLGPGTQTEQDDDSQVKNNAGGYVYSLPLEKQLERFLIIGTTGGTYYVSERKLTRDATDVVRKSFQKNPTWTINAISRISDEGRAPKNDYAILALGVCLTEDTSSLPHGHNVGLKEAFKVAVRKVCRTGTHILQLTEVINDLRGWGRRAKDVIASWYESQEYENLAYQVVKYRNRAGFTHKDVLRLAHPNPVTVRHNDVFKWVLGKPVENELPRIIYGYEAAKELKGNALARHIAEYRLSHEMIPDSEKDSPVIWQPLVDTMPVIATVRNLPKVTSLGMVKPLSDNEKLICQRLSNQEFVEKSRIHPIAVLTAFNAYSKGTNRNMSWKPSQNVLGALEDCFYLSFKNVEPSGKNTMIGLDISGSMWQGDYYNPSASFTPAEIGAAMCLITARTEPYTFVMAFTTQPVEVEIGKKTTLASLLKTTKKLSQNMAGTDCSQPMEIAISEKLNVDTFVVYTDNETYAGKRKPVTALKDYRKKSGRDAKLVVCGMTATQFTIADPKDSGMLDVVGFDSAAPQIIGQFSAGKL